MPLCGHSLLLCSSSLDATFCKFCLSVFSFTSGMDRAWMNVNRISREYNEGVKEFIRIDKGYTKWIWHGEPVHQESNHDDVEGGKQFDYMEDLTRNVEENLRDFSEKFEKLVNDSETPVYGGCTKFTRLLVMLRLYKLKVADGWSDKISTSLLDC